MTDRILLEPRHRAMLDTLVSRHLSNVEVWAYGSRINGRGHDGSDLDIVLRTPNLDEIPFDKLTRFTRALRNSNIPFLVDARDWARLPVHFHEEIKRNYVVLRSPDKKTRNSSA